MTPEEARGRRITVFIALLSAAPPVLILLLLALSGRQVTTGRWVMDGATNVILAWLLIKGKSWARMLTIAGFALGGTTSVLRALFVGGSILGRLIVILLGGIQIAAALVLVRSAAVKAYFREENDPATLKLGGA